MAQGFRQKYGINYYETCAPVVSHTTLRSFLTAVSYHNLRVKHIDIKIAFLHGDLKEEVYMSQPEGYKGDLRIKTSSTNLVYKNQPIS